MWTDRIKKDMEFTDEDIGEFRIIKDFLPPPEKLILKEKTEKITLSLTASSIHFFKEQAKLHHTQYQKMIRVLLDEYVMRCMMAKRKIKHTKKEKKTKNKTKALKSPR